MFSVVEILMWDDLGAETLILTASGFKKGMFIALCKLKLKYLHYDKLRLIKTEERASYCTIFRLNEFLKLKKSCKTWDYSSCLF